MTAPFDQDDEPTAMFVPSWDDADDAEPEGETVEEPPVIPPPDVTAEAPPTPSPEGTVAVEEAAVVEREPEAQPAPEPEREREERERTGSGTLRPLVPEPVVEARRARRPAASPSSAAGWALEKLRAASGLLVLVVAAGVGLAAAIGLVVFAVVVALQQAVGD